MSSTPASDYEITSLRASDFPAWSTLFRAYIDFYHSSIPETQYAKTFARLIDPAGDISGLVLRSTANSETLIGLAHYFPHPTPWSEEKIMHFNDLFIDPTIRAKGYGRAMIMAVRDEAVKAGCFRLEWATQHGNATARRLYDQLATCDFVEYRMKLK